MLDRCFFQERLGLPLSGTRFDRWPHDVVEQKRAVNQQSEADNLQPLECFPPKSKRDDPDEQGAARIDN